MPRPDVACLIAGAVLAIAACVGPGGIEEPVPVDETPSKLSDWHLLRLEDRTLQWRQDALAYDLNTPLFSDYAGKLRTVWVPPGTTASVAPDGSIDFPVGAVLTKTFYYREGSAGELMSASLDTTSAGGPLELDRVRLIETRVLVRRDQGWEALPYVWDEAEQDAVLSLAGDIQSLALTDVADGQPFSYVVPTRSECASCHAVDHGAAEIRPIGAKVRHLKKTFEYDDGVAPQMNRWQEAGILSRFNDDAWEATASWPPAPDVELDLAARSYLDINCGHCHSPVGPADTSGLFLHFEETSLRRLGMCKQPVAAGRGSGGKPVSIWPGDPARSILHFRMTSTDPAQMMPEIGRSLVHAEGVRLIGQWISAMEGACVDSLQEVLKQE